MKRLIVLMIAIFIAQNVISQDLVRTPVPNGSVSNLKRFGDTLFVMGNFTEIGYPLNKTTQVDLATGIVDTVFDTDLQGFDIFYNYNVKHRAWSIWDNGKWLITGQNQSFGQYTSGNWPGIKFDSLFFKDSSFNYDDQGSSYGTISTSILNYKGRIYLGAYGLNSGSGSTGTLEVIDSASGNLLKRLNNPAITKTIYSVGDTLILAYLNFSNTLRFYSADTSYNPIGFNFRIYGGITNNVNFLHDGNLLFVSGGFDSLETVAFTPSTIRKNIAQVDLTTNQITSWNPILVGSKINSMIYYQNNIILGGDIQSINGTSCGNIIIIDKNGNLVNSISGINGLVNSLVINGNYLYVGGAFTNVQGSGKNYLCRINLNTLLVDPSFPSHQLDGIVDEINCSNTKLLVIGKFLNYNSIKRKGIAAININNWSILDWDTKANNLITDIVKINQKLYVTGHFDSLNAQPRSFIGAFNESAQLLPWNPSLTSSGLQMVNNKNLLYIAGQTRLFTADTLNNTLNTFAPSFVSSTYPPYLLLHGNSLFISNNQNIKKYSLTNNSLQTFNTTSLGFDIHKMEGFGSSLIIAGTSSSLGPKISVKDVNGITGPNYDFKITQDRSYGFKVTCMKKVNNNLYTGFKVCRMNNIPAIAEINLSNFSFTNFQLPLSTFDTGSSPTTFEVADSFWICGGDGSILSKHSKYFAVYKRFQTVDIAGIDGDFALTKGTVYHDVDSNQVLNTLVDQGKPNFMLKLQGNTGTFHTLTEDNGDYYCYSDKDTLTITPINQPYLTAVSPSSNISYLPTDISCDSLNNDFLYSIIPYADLTVDFTTQILRPGFQTQCFLTARNLGTVRLSSTVKVTLPTGTTYVNNSSIPNPTITGSTLSWPVDTLNSFTNNTFSFLISVNSAVQIGDTMHFPFEIIPNGIDSTFNNSGNFDNNASELEEIVVGSWDPNSKDVSKKIMTPSELGEGQWLKYTINFQNTGTHQTEFVILTDSLDTTKLNLESIRMIHSSHPYQFQIKNNNCKWRFDNCKLQPSATDYKKSQGFVKFEILPKKSLVIGDSIKNFAKIVFDYNSPINTDTAITVIDTLSTVGINSKISQNIKLYPIPSSNKIIIETNHFENSYNYVIVNVLGVEILSGVIQNSLEEIDISTWPKGVYILKTDKNYLKFIKN